MKRVASLLPSATELVHFVGATGSLVGVTHECDYPPGVRSLPRLTASAIDHSKMTSAEIDASVSGHLTDADSLYTLNVELLGRLRPDLILTQGLCEVCSVSMNVVQRAIGELDSEPEVISLDPYSLEEVLQTAITVGRALGREDLARGRVAELKGRVARVREAASGAKRPRVACIEWLDPPFAAGHWVPEMVQMAGGSEVLGKPNTDSFRVSWEDVAAAEPEVIVLMPCGFNVERTLREAHLLRELPGWSDIPAVRGGRVWAVEANSYFSRPAPRLVEGIEILASIIHPELFPGPPSEEVAVRVA
ncbi:cobalamin-binding protein [Rubrobacter taiwanensis]|jgi:iron complex transport system substrate-binding protein|uniref:Cobalamin-binding protein n=1 Tax=Rubrobacter taiwanensis TaxID=185139 RepID=A0A4R1BTB4_9ACTN|nr:cobalamin-binding protein [Rubrobacter taiwanensis]TCJ20657.1 cobalamin-binding protein [Rubrobacter taiwanensis]